MVILFGTGGRLRVSIHDTVSVMSKIFSFLISCVNVKISLAVIASMIHVFRVEEHKQAKSHEP